MTARVIDTNVILVANRAHEDVSPECVIACVELLSKIMKEGRLVLDDRYRILMEYQRKTEPVRAKGVGDVFVRWALRNVRTKAKVQIVELTEVMPDCFAEFPDPALEATFDPADRKFAAVAHGHPAKPAISQAVDCKWIDWWSALAAHGVSVEFLCTDDICRFYSAAFPNKGRPELPL